VTNRHKIDNEALTNAGFFEVFRHHDMRMYILTPGHMYEARLEGTGMSVYFVIGQPTEKLVSIQVELTSDEFEPAIRGLSYRNTFELSLSYAITRLKESLDKYIDDVSEGIRLAEEKLKANPTDALLTEWVNKKYAELEKIWRARIGMTA
jgi:hypothetical protein